MPTKHKEVIRQFIRFFVVGVSNTAVDFGIYFALTRLVPFFGMYIYAANTVSFIAAASWSYYANRNWTFKQEYGITVSEATKFYISTGTAFLLNMLTLYVVVHGFHANDLLGKLAATGVSMVWNFILNKFWVFSAPTKQVNK